MSFDETIQDPIVANSSQNSLEKYKFVIGDDGFVYVRVKAKGEFVFSGLTESIKVTTFEVNDVAQQIPPTPLTNRNSLSIRNKSGTETVYIGPINVEAHSNIGEDGGWEIGPNEDFNFDIKNSVPVYAITESGKTAIVKILEMA